MRNGRLKTCEMRGAKRAKCQNKLKKRKSGNRAKCGLNVKNRAKCGNKYKKCVGKPCEMRFKGA